jgi:hypothetical protein
MTFCAEVFGRPNISLHVHKKPTPHSASARFTEPTQSRRYYPTQRFPLLPNATISVTTQNRLGPPMELSLPKTMSHNFLCRCIWPAKYLPSRLNQATPLLRSPLVIHQLRCSAAAPHLSASSQYSRSPTFRGFYLVTFPRVSVNI